MGRNISFYNILSVRSSALFSDYSYSQLKYEGLANLRMGKLLLKNRLFAQYMDGQSIAPESRVWLANDNPEMLMENKYFRSRGLFPVSNEYLAIGTGFSHISTGGGMNLRAYAGYAAPVLKDGIQVLTYSGTAGISYSGELEFDRAFAFRINPISKYAKLKSYLFYDAGSMGFQNEKKTLSMSDIKMDAGLGFALQIKTYPSLTEIEPFTIRFDMPFYVNTLSANETQTIKFRYLIGIGRSF